MVPPNVSTSSSGTVATISKDARHNSALMGSPAPLSAPRPAKSLNFKPCSDLPVIKEPGLSSAGGGVPVPEQATRPKKTEMSKMKRMIRVPQKKERLESQPLSYTQLLLN